MKLWKIGLYIVCLLIVLYLVFNSFHEGFQQGTNPISVLNVPYSNQYYEPYLVIPNIPYTPNYISPYSDTLNADGTLARNPKSETDKTYYNDAFTKAEATEICSSLNATLATTSQLQTAALLGGFWGVASWASDNENKYAIIPETAESSFKNTIRNSNASTIPEIIGIDDNEHYPLKQITSINVTKAFPVCWGVKPSQGTVLKLAGGSIGVHAFSDSDYTMYSPQVLGAVMGPSSSDLLQTDFTADQAVYALQQTNFSTKEARRFLINGLDGSSNVNNSIYRTAVGGNQYGEDVANLVKSPCNLLQDTYNKFFTQYSQVRDILRDISGGVIKMQRAKDENVRFQTKIQAVCQIETPTTSPACSKLATLDYELLYSTTGSDLSTSRLAKLELLNNTLFQRSQELCMAMDTLFSVQSIIGCPNLTGDLPRCQWNSLGSGSNSGSAYMLNQLQTNSEEYLRLKLKEISPYFSVSTYTELIAAINQLAGTLNIPTLNDFKTSDQNFSAVSTGIKTIQSFMANIGA